MELSVEKLKMQGKASVFVVDDSLVYRNLLRNAFGQDSDFRFLGTAIDGKFALPKIEQLRPDFVILDVEMPEMNGLDTLKEIRKKSPDTKVIMLSSLTVEGAKVTLQALELGAIDFISKPGVDSLGESGIAEVLESLASKIRSLHSASGSKFVQEEKVEVRRSQPKVGRGEYSICGIGISTGGPIALRELLSNISPDLNGIVVIAQHMPPLFTNYLAESLSSVSKIKVKEVEDGEKLEKSTAYIAQGGKQLEILRGEDGPYARVFSGPEEELCKPSVNILFRSLAKNFADETVAVIMTGMGEDGYLGMNDLRKNGAYLIAQTAESCTVFGMPSRPVKEGIVNDVLNIKSIAEKITLLLSRN
ncbi:chemotaxis-specific protein-glutamate methyltransferase CheB [Leptospira wolffii]|uniref:chemotaxis-specific protein-glutamate methyltransferase CheB n=1 Tax=Leptospira wolffii TaxID=409998 RepID=UPI001083A69B|nr:chemotaxis-specific protein-glutamate methyltransferase CheB [Leptospira wolffii]TGL47532.1 chemotaxis-specific protein-glutamate methyltransferase CheB [Leptospira wolffii]